MMLGEHLGNNWFMIVIFSFPIYLHYVYSLS